MDDDDYWFVRRRGPFSYTINPSTWQGWAVTAVYVAVTLALTPLAECQLWFEWGGLLTLATMAFVVVLLRKSEPERK